MVYKPLNYFAFVQIYLISLWLFAACRTQGAIEQSFGVTRLLTTFPPCFSMEASLYFSKLSKLFHARLVCCIRYDQQIDCILKGPFGIELMRGTINKKGLTVINRFRRLVHQWDYKQIREQYHCSLNYPFIQSLLLGVVYRPMKDGLSIPDPLSSDLVYSYDDLTGKIIAAALIDKEWGKILKFLYQYKVVEGSPCLASIKIEYTLHDKGACNSGRLRLYNLHFKKLERPNIKLTIPTYYRKAVEVPDP